MFDFLSLANMSPVSKEKYQRRARVYDLKERAPTSEQDARLAVVTARALRSLQKSGAGTVEDFVARLGIDYDEAERALARLVSYREARVVRKPYGLLYAPPQKVDDGFPPGTEYVLVGSKSLPLFKDPSVDRYERVASDTCVAAIARFFATTGVSLCSSLAISKAVGVGRQTVAATLRTLAQQGRVQRVPVAEARCRFAYSEVAAWRVVDKAGLFSLFDGGESLSPVQVHSARLWGAALRERIIEFLKTRPARYREIVAAFPNCSPDALVSAVHTLRNNGLIEPDGKWHGKWRVVEGAPTPPPPKRARDDRPPYYGVARATVEDVYARVVQMGAEGVELAGLCDELLSSSTTYRALGALLASNRVRRERTDGRSYRYFAT